MTTVTVVKRCCRCKLEKSVDAFGADRSRHDGRARYCRACRAGRVVTVDAARRDVNLGGGHWLRVAMAGGLLALVRGIRNGATGPLVATGSTLTIPPRAFGDALDAMRAITASDKK